jgi:hypothetical protein
MSGRPHRGTLRIRVAGAALGALLALAPLSCTSAEDEFCGRLGDTYQLDELVTSISGLDHLAAALDDTLHIDRHRRGGASAHLASAHDVDDPVVLGRFGGEPAVALGVLLICSTD